MNKDFIFLKPKLVYRLWGNDVLNAKFKDNSVNCPGEAWIISAIKDDCSTLSINNQSFDNFFKTNKEFFDNYHSDEYPLLTKVISTSADLSIQVHPGNNYAKQFNSLGKTECWYVLDSNQGYIYVDENKSKEEKIEAIKNNNLKPVIRKWHVNKGDFYFIPAQTIHAIGKDVLIFELQQSSDLTFRIDDFNRIDATTGSIRQLHIEDAYKCIESQEQEITTTNKIINPNLQLLTCNEYFSLYKITNTLQNSYNFENSRWLQIYVVNGSATINGISVKENDSIVVNSSIKTLEVDGNVELMISFVNKNN